MVKIMVAFKSEGKIDWQMDVFNKYRYGEAIMFAVTWVIPWGGLRWMDKTLTEEWGHGGCRSYLTQVGKQISLLCLWFKINLSTLQILSFWGLFPTLLIITEHLSSVFSISTLSQNRNPISLLSPAISQDAVLCTSCRRMSAYVSAIFHTSTTTTTVSWY